MNLPTHLPHLLLVEDDTVSRAFLVDALLALPATVDAADSIAAARQFIENRDTIYSLWLIDAGLPDGDGIMCLSALKERCPTTPALAITAEAFEDRLQQLRMSGFIDVLQKPIPINELQAAVRDILCLTTVVEQVSNHSVRNLLLWDNAQALSVSGGRQETVVALRRLFLDELPQQQQIVIEAIAHNDADAARATLHKLKASCGFVGASQLLDAVQVLSENPLNPEALRYFQRCFDNQISETTLNL